MSEHTHIGEDCPTCGARIGPTAEFPWHYWEEDCRAIRQPMSEHTPGPWHIEIERGSIGNGSVTFVADSNLGEPWLVCRLSEREAAEKQANARLIAAAPDLLEAARDIEAFLASLDKAYGIHKRDGYDKLRAAIAKAEGGQS